VTVPGEVVVPSNPNNPTPPTNNQQPNNPNPPSNQQPTTNPNTNASGNIVRLPEGVKYKNDNQIDSSLVPRIQGLNSELKTRGIDWQVTESYNTTTVHKADCHKTGTCFDANFTGNTTATASNIKTFIEVANNNNFRAVYEVKTEQQKNNLIANGVPANNILKVSAITAPHFSVYNK